jgi:serine/threonine-protein kinase HipA
LKTRKELCLDVCVSGRKAGEIELLDGQVVRFQPDAQWLESGQTPPLGLAFLADPSPRVNRDGRLPAWFENLLPEQGSVLRRWICRQNSLDERDSLGLLSALGHDLPGAVEVLGETQAPANLTPENLDEPTLRFSLTGLQLKLSMVRKGTGFTLPAYDENGAWIVKISGHLHPDLPEVEAATMESLRVAHAAWPDVADQAPPRQRDALAEHWRSVPILREIGEL